MSVPVKIQKTCAKCLQTYIASEAFLPKESSPDGYGTRCIHCRLRASIGDAAYEKVRADCIALGQTDGYASNPLSEAGERFPWKLCPRCNELLPTSDFHPSRLAKDGLASWCKNCTRTYQRNRRRAYS